MPAFVVQIRQASLGSWGPRFQTVCALGEDEAAALTLVRTALRLEDEELSVLRMLAEREVQQIGLKPFQVKRLP